MKAAIALTAMVMLGACVSTPLAPDPTIDPRGDYRVVAVNGEATGGGERYSFTVTPPTGSARFGCNAGGGSLVVERGYLVTGDWIITAAGCPSRPLPHLERVGFRITSQPMAIERGASGGIRLRNQLGSIDLVKLPAPIVIGEWRAVRIDNVALRAWEQLTLVVGPNEFRAVTCNHFSGGYRLDGRQIVRVGPWSQTERGCFDPTGTTDPMAFEERVFAMLRSPMTASNPTPDMLRLESRGNRIDFERRR